MLSINVKLIPKVGLTLAMNETIILILVLRLSISVTLK